MIILTKDQVQIISAGLALHVFAEKLNNPDKEVSISKEQLCEALTTLQTNTSSREEYEFSQLIKETMELINSDDFDLEEYLNNEDQQSDICLN